MEYFRKYYQADPREFLVFDDRKLVYLVIPKVACTSIKNMSARAYGIHTEEIYRIHQREKWSAYQVGLLQEDYPGYCKFAFVRNPFSRLVSCYQDKVLSSGPDGLYLKEQTFPGISSEMSFADFVQQVARIPDRLADRHFKSQYANLYHRGKLLVDYIGKF